MEPELIKRVVEEFIPFNRFLGIRVAAQQRGRIALEIPWREELVGDPVKRALHGGVISALVDTAGGMAVWSEVDYRSMRVSTIDLRIDYLRPGKMELVVADASVVRVGRSVGVADMRVYHPSDPGVTVATGKGVYAISTRKHQAPTE